MSVQVIIGFYAIICLMMIIFNLSYLQIENIRNWYLSRQTMYLSKELQEEIARNLEFPTDEHRAMLRKKLRRLPGMESFDYTMEQLYKDSPKASEHYLNGISTVFEDLVPYFSKRDQLRRAYFAAITKRWYRARPCNPKLIDAFTGFINSHALYTRQNALEAIVEIGSPKDISRAVHVLDSIESEHSSRLVSETLLMYPGDRDELADALLSEFDSYSLQMRVCFINFLRLSDSGRIGQVPPFSGLHAPTPLLSGNTLPLQLLCLRPIHARRRFALSRIACGAPCTMFDSMPPRACISSA